MDAVADDPDLSFLNRGGEMGRRMRSLDWSATGLGDPRTWPHSLKAAVRIMLTSRFAMWMAWGPDLIFFCNDAYLPTVGIKGDWVLGARSDDVWAEIWPDIGPRIDHVLRTGEATWDEALLLYLERRGFTEESYHTFSYSPLADDGGRTVGMLCVVAEVTDRVIGERQLATLRDLGTRLGATSSRNDVMRALTDCLSVNSADVPFALVYLREAEASSARLAAVHGADREAPRVVATIDLGAVDAVWPAGAAEHRTTVIPLADGDVGRRSLDHWQQPPHQAVVLPIAGPEGGAAIGRIALGLNPHRAFDADYAGFLDLLTGQVAAAIARADDFERERARAESLAEIDRAKTAFFSNVSHEFRTPLTLMLGPLEEALAKSETALDTSDRHLVEVAHRNGLRLLRLVNALLDFSRIEAGRSQVQFVPTDLSALTTELASSFSSATEKAGLDLIVDCPDLDAPVMVDRDMWEKIVLNLLSNAFKFTFEGVIAVSLTGTSDHAVLTVSDTGTGIAADELPRLFERFHRVEGARGRSFEGSGIGLALVRELVSLHSGSISVESEVGRGTTFRIEIPRQQVATADAGEGGEVTQAFPLRAQAVVEEAMLWLPDAPSHGGTSPPVSIAAGPEPAATSPHAGARILVADDNADLRQYVTRLMRDRGYVVDAVADGIAALDAVRAMRPDVIVTDVMMPGLDGFGLLRAIREDAELRDLPVIMLSARAGEEVRAEGLDAGADDYLTKPFAARELIARVDATLAMARLRRESAAALRRVNETLEQRVHERTRERDRMWALSRDPFLVTDRDGRWLSISPVWTELLGWTEEELLGRTPEWMEHPDDRNRTRNEGDDIVSGDTTRRFENRFRTRSGDYRWFSWTAVPEGEVIYAVARDVTARKQAAAELEQAQAALRQSQKMEAMGQLTGGVAHDFNNLLTPIVGSLDMLQRKALGGEREQRLIAGAMEAAERAKVLVQRLLAFARRQPLQSTAIDVAALVTGMAALMESTTGPQIKVVTEVGETMRPAVADANQLEMALLNLCVNARDAMPDGGTLRVSASEIMVGAHHPAGLVPGAYIRLSVADTGAGMDEATIARAIEPFFSTKGVGKGTGLGLSMVHGLASQLGGALTIQSRLNVGTNIELWLPVSAAALPEPSKGNAALPVVRSAGRALLVDDEDIVRLSIADMLANLGYEVSEARSAEEAIRLMRDGMRPNLLVTDHLMPGLSGTELARALRAEHPGMQILIVSGYAEAEDVAPDLPRLTKPFRSDELEACLAAFAVSHAQ